MIALIAEGIFINIVVLMITLIVEGILSIKVVLTAIVPIGRIGCVALFSGGCPERVSHYARRRISTICEGKLTGKFWQTLELTIACDNEYKVA